MEFGRVYDSLEDVDFTLPPDTETTIKTLKTKGNVGELSVFVGASKWGEKTWEGKIYPKKLPENERLKVYSQNFDAVEFGLTWYNIYEAAAIKRWTDQVSVSPKFMFCPKFPQAITHIRRLNNVEEHTSKFYESLTGFGNHLGPLMLQVGDNFTPKSFPQLKAYLEALPTTQKVSVEIRHKDWYANMNHRNELLQLLYDLNIGMVISDTSGRRDCVHMELTTSDVIIRFVGNNLADSDYKRMDAWVERLKVWAEQGLKSIWFFMHQNDERFVPDACIYLIGQLNAKLGITIKAPIIIAE